VPATLDLARQLADAAGDVDAFRATFKPEALRDPGLAAEVATRLLAAGRVDEAGDVLRGAKLKAADPDFAWETVWIDWLERSGQAADAQSARWSSFERTLSAERVRDFARRLKDFEDVEAEHRAIDHASAHPDAHAALRFLMDWPALPEAARMIQARPDDLRLSAEEAELWAGRLRPRHPAAAHALLRKAAAAAFARRDFKTCDRLTEEADAIPLG
jgi:hypothetical protein